MVQNHLNLSYFCFQINYYKPFKIYLITILIIITRITIIISLIIFKYINSQNNQQKIYLIVSNSSRITPIKMLALSQIQHYQEKIVRLQADTIIYQDQIARLRKKIIDLQQYRIKYQLLLEKGQQESPLHRSRRVDELTHMNKKIDENNQKWSAKVKLLQSKYQKMIQDLQQQSVSLLKQLQYKKSQSPSLQTLKSNILILEQQNKTLRFQNNNLTNEIIHIRNQTQEKICTKQSELNDKIHQAINNQKQFYRESIAQLQKTIQLLKQQIQFHKVRASPERQREIFRLNSLMENLREQNDTQILKVNLLINAKNKQIEEMTHSFKKQKQQMSQINQNLQNQLSKASQKVFTADQECHSQLMQCRRQMTQIRQKQMKLMKQQFKNVQDSFDTQRQQWKLILNDQQQQIKRIKSMWDEEKQKYMEQKNKLKAKIAELKQRMKRSSEQQKELVQNQTFKMIKSLKNIDEYQDKYNDYENGITFLHRQLKRATAKLQQKSRQTSKLLKQLQTQKQQFDNQVEFIKKVQRQQVQYFRSKLLQIDQTNSKLLEQIRQKQKYIRDRQIEHKLTYDKFQAQNQALKNLIQQMQRDYRRITDHKQNLYQSYRSQRDNVFTGKAQLNQQRKNKRLHLARQKNELQIAYKQRQKQVIQQYQLKINQLQQKLSKLNHKGTQNQATIQILKQKINIDEKENTRHNQQANQKQFHKKAASLDLQISLAQNLFKTLQTVRQRTNKSQRNKSQLDELSSHQSGSMTSRQRKINQLADIELNQEDFVGDNVAPTFSRQATTPVKKDYNFIQTQKSKSRQKPKVKTINYPKSGLQLSFHPVQSQQQSQGEGRFGN